MFLVFYSCSNGSPNKNVSKAVTQIDPDKNLNVSILISFCNKNPRCCTHEVGSKYKFNPANGTAIS